MNNAILHSKQMLHKKAKSEKNLFVLLVVGPNLVGYLIFILYPNILSIYYSLLEWDGLSKPKFVGLQNFIMLFKDRFMWTALSHNLIMIIIIPLITMLISVFLADILVSKTYKENSFYKVLFFFPNTLSVVVLGLIWSFAYDGQFGLLNAIIKLMGINIGDFYWLGNQQIVLAAVMIPLIWMNVCFYFLIFMNAMSSIPKSLYESAILDGITNTKRLFKITLPLISGILRVALILMIINIFKGFEFIMILTRGGPGGASDVIGLYMFNYAFSTATSGGLPTITNYGYASAIGLILFVVLVSFKVGVDRFFTQDSIEY